MKKIKQNFTNLEVSLANALGGAIALIGILLFLLFHSTTSHAYELGIKYGLGLDLPNATDPSEAKFASVELSNELGHLFRHKLSAGAWFDPHLEYNRTSASFGAYSIGLRVEPGVFYMENYFGFGWISQVDSMLSTSFEFTEEIGVGIKDDLGRFIGVEYRHFSNAGIQTPNKGRDFFLINTGVKL